MENLEKYLVLYPNGSLRWSEMPHRSIGDCFRTLIGCNCLEYVSFPYLFGCVLDESGAIGNQRQQPNLLASRFYPGAVRGHLLHGPVIFVREGLVDGEPDWVPLTDEDLLIISLILGKPVPKC